MSGLTPKQRLFVVEYLKDLNATQAAIRAGYSEATAKQQGSRLLTNVDIQAEIATKVNKRMEKAELSAEYVLEGIREVVERCKQAEPVLDKEGTPTGEYRFDATNSLKGYELLGKHLKLWIEKHEHNVKSTTELTDEQLGALLVSFSSGTQAS